ncbi:S-layer homology domain-containing protein [Treponema sp.]|uniref:S-layer homology domain-containing protein n=1 Tax=Treponema sp. TaxID=166 RepID=UPI003F0CC047
MKKSIFKTIILISALALAAAPVFSQTKRKTQSQQTQRQKQTKKTQSAEMESTQSYWEGAPAVLKKTPFKFEGGTGTLKDPYLIKTADQLNSVRFGLSKHYKLIADIDLSKWGNWIPLGGTPAYGGSWIKKYPQAADAGCGEFTGSFDGNGHVISGMTIIDHNDDIFMGEAEATRAYALFGAIFPENNSFIRNLGVVNYTIDISHTKMKYNCDLRVAAISNYAAGLIVENCYTSGGKIKVHTGRAGNQTSRVYVMAGGMFTEIEDSRITNCYNASPIIITTSDTDYMNYNYTTTTRQLGDLRSARAGGIAMQMMYTHITSCMNAGEITVPYANFGYGNSLAGGIVGKVVCLGQQLIHNLPPETASTITSCYNIGKITGTYASGILGFTSTDCYISDCYNVGELVLDEDNPQKDYIPTFKDDIIIQGCNILEYGKKYVHDNGIKVVHGSRWIDSPKLGRKILKAIPEDKLGIKPSEPEAATQIAGFTDVKSSDDFARAVPWAVEKGIAKPSSKTTFSPNDPCTRGQVVTYIYRWQGSPKVSGKNPFKDVKPSDTFYNAALWAYKNGFLEGNTFNGNAPCTRGDALEILWKCSGSMEMIAIDNFTDVPRSSKYQQPVSWAYYGAIAKPTTKTTFEPESVCTKGQIVTFIYQVEHTGLKDWMDTTQQNANSSQVNDIVNNAIKQMGLEDLFNGNQF